MKVLVTGVVSAVLGSALSLTVVGQAQTAKTPSAVAYVSAQRILAESTRGRAEATRVTTLQQQKTTELRTRAQALEAVRQEMASTTDPAARAAAQQKEIQQRTELERAQQQAQIELQTLQREINTDMNQRVRAILDDLMKTQSYSLVLNSDTSLMWVQPELDMTSAVVTRLNAQP